jgi:hypothetical protein
MDGIVRLSVLLDDRHRPYVRLLNIGLQAMPLPPPPDQTIYPPLHEDPDTFFPALLTVTRPEEIPAALAQGRPVLIDIPAFQWRASLLATVQKWGGKLVWWIVKFLAAWWLAQWLNAQLPTKDYLVPDWAKFNFVRQPDHKVILSPHEE